MLSARTAGTRALRNRCATDGGFGSNPDLLFQALMSPSAKCGHGLHSTRLRSAEMRSATVERVADLFVGRFLIAGAQ